MNTPQETPPRRCFDIDAVRRDFPILARPLPNGATLAYLDNGATSQKPQAVIDKLSEVYETVRLVLVVQLLAACGLHPRGLREKKAWWISANPGAARRSRRQSIRSKSSSGCQSHRASTTFRRARLQCSRLGLIGERIATWWSSFTQAAERRSCVCC